MNTFKQATNRELTAISQQLTMFAKIRELYNIDFAFETDRLMQRAEQLKKTTKAVG